MSPTPRTNFERHCDVAVIGGSAAGLAAALQLGRQRRSVIVVDDGTPRNAPAAHMHGYLGHEGCPPSAFVARGREEVRSYGGQVLNGRAVGAERLDDDRFRVHLTGGQSLVARRLVIATGLVDILPAIDGVAELWGDRVIHCPFCHGYEFRDRRIVQIVDTPLSWHTSLLYRHLTDRLTIVVADHLALDDEQRARWEAGGVDVRQAAVSAVAATPGERTVTVVLADGEQILADAVAIGTRVTARVGPFEAIGVSADPHPSGAGDVVTTDAAGATGVAGVYAAGNVTDPSQQVIQAAANGSWVGAMVSFDLAEEDLGRGSRSSAVEFEWDDRYGGEQIWSGNPNGALVAEVAELEPGRALDIGAGEGGDAIWLAERGWSVTANDISARALDRIAAAAEARGLTVECLRADANDPEPYPAAAFDLVTAHYASILRTPDARGIDNLVAAVAPGGTLLVVNHDPSAMRAPVDPGAQTRVFDADAYLRADAFDDHIGRLPGWEIVTHELRPRPPGSASASHHVDDVIFRARRNAE